ncbi:hypothetical protein SAMN04488245_114107 [Alloyangia pacifica]|uniref:Uncharacterized protein n=1 Tax=Alloyangia pacifica TaxID=311180 RepID=A0A1I6UZS5_9RHOB|nr:hypothetical protein SAMN04488245_114107 [Alloyangia pacifica]SFT06929.1 hypothetical protein SAMN04488050_109156 [Alloyangia pacifica]
MGRCDLQLSFEERIGIAKWREAKMQIPEIADRLSRALHHKMVQPPPLKAAALHGLSAGWSPEQIAGRMRLEQHGPVCATRRSMPTPTRRWVSPSALGLGTDGVDILFYRKPHGATGYKVPIAVHYPGDATSPSS